MRIAIAASLIGASLIVGATAPALAQEPVGPPLPREEGVARTLGDPALQADIAARLAAVVGAVMDTRIGVLAPVDPGVRPDERLRDRVAPGVEGRVYADARRTTALMGAMAGQVAAAMPALRAEARRLEDAVGRALGPLDDRADDDGDAYDDDPAYDDGAYPGE